MKHKPTMLKVRDYLVKLKIICKFDLTMAQLHLISEKNILNKISLYFYKMKLKRTIKKIDNSLVKITIHLMELHCKTFKEQLLQRDLKYAVRNENYEYAAILRDAMKLN